MSFDIDKYVDNKDFLEGFVWHHIAGAIIHIICILILTMVIYGVIGILLGFEKSNNWVLVACVVVSIYLVPVISSYLYIKNNYENIKNCLEKEYKEEVNLLELKESSINNYLIEQNKIYDNINNDFLKTFKYCGELIADINTIQYENSAKYLKEKKRPARAEALRIQALKAETKKYIAQYKAMKYEYDYLFSLVPELENYVESGVYVQNIEELKENYDYVRTWVSREEYDQLSENDRNQLALDRYIESRKKNKWQIGRDYEMFIGHKYETEGYIVEYTGITKRLEDMGRDLIAKNGDKILIIQCKNWSKTKEIHENHICQLFGTVKQYNLENHKKAKGVLITSTSLSATARNFAKYLKIEVIENLEFKEFPRIKCNIGKNNERIYHLPFDQQYDNTIIGDKKGEFFAWTVEEASKRGFRRAKKYFVTN